METKANEMWAIVEGWPKYRVSKMGDVIFLHDGISRIKTPVKGSGGYYRVSFWDKPNKRVQTFAVHRLVARYFVEGRDERLDVAHLDGDKSNNKASNLKWCSRSENENHKRNHGTFVRGARIPVINNSGLIAIKSLRKVGWSQKKIASLFGVCQQTICNALKPKYAEAIIKALNENKAGE